MMWLDDKQYAYLVEVTANWTMDQLVALTNLLASTEPIYSFGQFKQFLLENIAQI